MELNEWLEKYSNSEECEYLSNNEQAKDNFLAEENEIVSLDITN